MGAGEHGKFVLIFLKKDSTAEPQRTQRKEKTGGGFSCAHGLLCGQRFEFPGTCPKFDHFLVFVFRALLLSPRSLRLCGRFGAPEKAEAAEVIVIENA